MTRRLAIVAHYDARGGAAPHFLRQLEALAAEFDDIVVAAPSALTDEAVDAISARARLLRRANYGHDFGSWRDALEQNGWAQGYDELLLTNDSYVGYFRPLGDIMRTMAERPCELWGMSRSARHDVHVQSYYLHFTSAALHSQAFRRFWMDARPATDRMSAILDQEIGISRAMRAAGFALGAFLEPTRSERLLATRRGVHWLRRRKREFPARFDSLEDDYFTASRRRDPAEADFLNWSAAFADLALDDGRFPLVKFDTLRYDPYWLGAGTLLDRLEKRYPEQMQDVRAFLDETAEAYQRRRYENHGFSELTPWERMSVGYTTATALRGATRTLGAHA